MLFIHCLLLLPFLWGICVCSLFRYAVRCVLSSFSIMPLVKREMIALLYCLLDVMLLFNNIVICLFLMVP